MILSDPLERAKAFLACSPLERADWLARHREHLDLRIIETYKQMLSDVLYSNPATADTIVVSAIHIAKALTDEPLAHPLTDWLIGNREAHRNPQEAIQCYERSLQAYRTHGDPLSVARLLGNLVMMYTDITDTSRFDDADAAYQEAKAIYDTIDSTSPDWMQVIDWQQALEQNYGWLLHERGRYEQALPIHDQALEHAHMLEMPDVANEVLTNRIQTQVMLGHMSVHDGMQALLECRSVAQSYEQWLTVARIDMVLGEFASAMGYPLEALYRLQAARQQFEKQHNTMEIGSVMLREAHLLAHIGMRESAVYTYRKAHSLFEEKQMLKYAGEACYGEAVVHRREGMYHHVHPLLDKADAIWHTLGLVEWQTKMLLERIELALVWDEAPVDAIELIQTPVPDNASAELSLWYAIVQAEVLTQMWTNALHPDNRKRKRKTKGKGRNNKQAQGEVQEQDPSYYHQQATASAEHALQLARQRNDHWHERRALALLGNLALPEDPDTACFYLDAAVACDDQIRRMLHVEELKASFLEQHDDLLPTLVHQHIAHDRPLQALSYIWRAKGSALFDLLQESRIAHKLATEHTDEVAAIQYNIEHVRQQLAYQRLQLTHAPSTGTSTNGRPSTGTSTNGRPSTGTSTVQQTINQLQEHLYDLRRRRLHLASVPSEHTMLAQPLQALPHMQADVLIEYMRCGTDLFAACLYADGTCSVTPLGKARDIVSLTHKFWSDCMSVVRSIDLRKQNWKLWIRETQPTLQACYDMLIAPLGALPAGARLLIAPCSPLYSIPFAALWDGHTYLIEQHEIELTPCGALMLVPPATQDTLAPPLALATTYGGMLAGSVAQVEAVQKAFPDSVCMVDDAQDLHMLMSMQSPPRLLHIAAHHDNSVIHQNPIFSAFHITGGLFSVEQCFDLPLTGTELVTLGGCTTAAGLDTGGSLLAFQSACFVAGAQRVLASCWPLHESDSAVLMEHFYGFLSYIVRTESQLNPATALRHTQLALLEHSDWSHPAIWANFVCCRR